MSYLRYVARRAAFALLSVYLVVTATFVLINVTVSVRAAERVALARHGCRGAVLPEECPSPEELESVRQGFLAARDWTTPVHERYVGWLVDVTTLQWGYSFAYGEPVREVLDGRIVTTLEYVVPGFVLAVVLGVVLGLFAALSRNDPFDWSARLGAYLLLGIPVFMFVIYWDLLEMWGTVPEVHKQVVAALAVAASLLAGQVRFSRTASLEQTGKAFIKTLRAKGANRRRLARHVLRNAALPILSLSVSEMLAVLVLQIYILEDVLGIRGLAGATLRGVDRTDFQLVIWSTMVVVALGVTGNFLQDVLYGYLDPRIRAD